MRFWAVGIIAAIVLPDAFDIINLSPPIFLYQWFNLICIVRLATIAAPFISHISNNCTCKYFTYFAYLICMENKLKKRDNVCIRSLRIILYIDFQHLNLMLAWIAEHSFEETILLHYYSCVFVCMCCMNSEAFSIHHFFSFFFFNKKSKWIENEIEKIKTIAFHAIVV